MRASYLDLANPEQYQRCLVVPHGSPHYPLVLSSLALAGLSTLETHIKWVRVWLSYMKQQELCSGEESQDTGQLTQQS